MLQLQGALGFSLINECTGLGLSCLISMQRIASLGIPFMNPIPVQVAAINKLGQGEWSLTEQSQTVRQTPGQMQPVTRGTKTTKFQIEVNWLPLTTQSLTGDSAITSY